MELPKKHYRKLIKILPILGAVALFFGVFLNVRAEGGDPLYELVWTQSYNENATDAIIPNKMVQTQDGGYIRNGYGSNGSNQNHAAIEKFREVEGGMEKDWVVFSQTARTVFWSVVEVSDSELLAVGRRIYGSSANGTNKYQGFISRFEKDENDDFVETESMLFEYAGYMSDSNAHQTVLDDLIMTDSGRVFIVGHYDKYRGTQTTGHLEGKSFALELNYSAESNCQSGEKLCSENIVQNFQTNTGSIAGTIFKTLDNRYVISAYKLFELDLENGGIKTIEGAGLISSDGTVAQAVAGEYVGVSKCTYSTMRDVISYKPFKTLEYDYGENFVNAYTNGGSGWNVGSGTWNNGSTDLNLANQQNRFCTRVISTSDNQYLFYGRAFIIGDGSDNESWIFTYSRYRHFIQKMDGDGNVIWTHIDSSPWKELVTSVPGTISGTYIFSDFYGNFYEYKDNTEYHNINYHIVSDVKPKKLVHSNTQYPNNYETDKANRTIAAKNEVFGSIEDYNTFVGYNFNGWYLDEELTQIPPADASPSSDRDWDYYGAYTKIQYDTPIYTIAYEGETQIGEPQDRGTVALFVDEATNTPAISESGYVFDGWYTGTIENGERVYSTTTKLAPGFTLEPEQVGTFDFLWAKMQHQQYTVYYDVNYDSNTCGVDNTVIPQLEQNGTLYSREILAYGNTINLKSTNQSKSCVLTNLSARTYSNYAQIEGFDLNTPVTSDIYVYGGYIKNSIIVENDSLYYANGEAVGDVEGISWYAPTKTLTLNNYNYLDIEVKNGEFPVTIVLQGDNVSNINSSNTPIIISGDGSLSKSNENSYLINVKGANLTIEGGTFIGNSNDSYGDINSNSAIIIGREEVDNGNIYIDAAICSGTYDNPGELTVNGGTLNISELSLPGDGAAIIKDGNIAILDMYSSSNDITIEGGTVNIGGDNGESESFEIFTMNGGEVNVKSGVSARSIIVNDGELNAPQLVPDMVFIQNGGTVNTAMLMVQGMYGRGGYVVFNGGIADIGGGYPLIVMYPGTLEDFEAQQLSSAISSLNNYKDTICANYYSDISQYQNGPAFSYESVDECKDKLINDYTELFHNNFSSYVEERYGVSLDMLPTEAGVAFNGGDVTLSAPTVESFIGIYLSMYGSMIDAQVQETMSQTIGEYETEEAWVNASCSAEGIPSINSTITATNSGLESFADVVESINSEREASGLEPYTYTIAPFATDDDGTDCKSRLSRDYPKLMKTAMTIGYLGEMMEEAGVMVENMPSAIMVAKMGDEGAVEYSESAIYVDTSKMVVTYEGENGTVYIDPENLKVSEISGAMFGEENSSMATLSDGDLIVESYDYIDPETGEPVINEETGEPYQMQRYANALKKIRIFEQKDWTISFSNEDNTPIGEPTTYHDGDEVLAPEITPTKETTPKYQYEFVGWTDGENTYASDEIPNASGDVTYTPVFNQQEYTIDYAWHEDKDTYEIGADDDKLSLIIDVNVNYFNHVVKVDGEAITEDTDYVITSGSTIVTLQDSYLDTLSVGPHTIDVYFDEPTEDEDVVVPSVFAVTRSGGNDDPDDPGNMGNPDDPNNPGGNNDSPDDPTDPNGGTDDPDNPTDPNGGTDEPGSKEDTPSVPGSDGGPTDNKPGAGNHGFGHFGSSAAIATISLALVASLAGAFTYKKIKSRK